MQDAAKQHPIQFFTATILEWKRLIKPDKYKDIIIESPHYVTDKKRIEVFSFIIMPNHIHIIWRIGENSMSVNVQRDFLKFTSPRIIKDLQKITQMCWKNLK